MAISNANIIKKDVTLAIQKFRAVEKHLEGKQRKKVLKKGGKVLIDAVRPLIPEADEPVYRYSTPKVSKDVRAPRGKGNVVAVYMPGNLRRAYKDLNLKKTDDVFVGPWVPKTNTTGTFSGKRVDGWYMHLIEFGSKFMAPVAPIRRGLASSVGRINSVLRKGFKDHMEVFERRNKIA